MGAKHFWNVKKSGQRRYRDKTDTCPLGKRDRCMHGALIDGDGYGTMRGMFAICEPLYRTESFLPYLTAISLCYQHVQSSLKL